MNTDRKSGYWVCRKPEKHLLRAYTFRRCRKCGENFYLCQACYPENLCERCLRERDSSERSERRGND